MKRCAVGAGIFPNAAFVLHSISIVLFKESDEWQTSNRHKMVEAFAQIDGDEIPPFSAQPQKPTDHRHGPSENLHRLDGRGRHLPSLASESLVVA
ncbi:hypothetical protein [Puniceibacterium sp. IMCC21224]|uniref:hypothetical protein n=1 Tax=Puniceibacterium sp. IMCC21224 TaxID=1618204 RepID=UPI00064DFD7A|nr:hypothetical protein [Puniceibacterium sp. IMCC21224]